MRHLLLTLALVLIPRWAFACPVCFGQNDSPLTTAMKAGVIAMLGIVLIVLGGFASFIVYLMRRARAVPDRPDLAPEDFGRSHPEEGTARC